MVVRKKRIKEGGFLTEDICGVYLIISPSGRRYVGSSINIRERWAEYRRKGHKSFLQNSFIKYGYDAHVFKVLFECDPENRLFWERVFGDMYLCLTDFGGLNHSLPGYNEVPMVKSQDLRRRISLSKTKYNSPEEKRIGTRNCLNRIKRQKAAERKAKFGDQRKFGTKEHMAKIRPLSTEARQTDEFRNKMREVSNKRFENQDERDRISRGLKKHFEKPEARDILRKNAIKMFSNPETHPRSKKVINIETNETFCCVKLAAESIGRKRSWLSSRLNGQQENDTNFRYLAA